MNITIYQSICKYILSFEYLISWIQFFFFVATRNISFPPMMSKIYSFFLIALDMLTTVACPPSQLNELTKHILFHCRRSVALIFMEQRNQMFYDLNI